MHPETEPPQQSAIVDCPCCESAYRYSGKQIIRGSPQKSQNCKRRPAKKPDGAVLIAASIVAAVRLRGQEIHPSPKLNDVVHDSILLARTILRELERR